MIERDRRYDRAKDIGFDLVAASYATNEQRGWRRRGNALARCCGVR